MDKPIRILHVLGALEIGGAESRTMDIYRRINREKIQFDFLVHTTKECFYNQEIRQLGGNIYCLPRFRVYNYFSYRKACKQFFEEHKEYEIVHAHMTSTASIYLPIAKKAGVKVAVAHARSAGVDKGVKGFITKCLRKNLYKKCDHMFSCSDLASEAVFGKTAAEAGEVIVLPNAVDTKAYKRDEETREKVRAEHGLLDNFVVGHVGSFRYAKNHEFVIEVFAEFLKKKENAKLMLLGDGERRQEMEEKAREMGIYEKILFCGNRHPIIPYYQAMDAYLFPSRYEGMPGVVIEAQMAGLPCLVADTITTQVKVTPLVEFMSLQQNAKEWAERLYEISQKEKDTAEIDLTKTNYDVNYQVKQYEAFYQTGDVSVMK